MAAVFWPAEKPSEKPEEAAGCAWTAARRRRRVARSRRRGPSPGPWPAARPTPSWRARGRGWCETFDTCAGDGVRIVLPGWYCKAFGRARVRLKCCHGMARVTRGWGHGCTRWRHGWHTLESCASLSEEADASDERVAVPCDFSCLSPLQPGYLKRDRATEAAADLHPEKDQQQCGHRNCARALPRWDG
eukprot:scaffold1202_cov61-Phaeocystis_antarctica.AAC.3